VFEIAHETQPSPAKMYETRSTQPVPVHSIDHSVQVRARAYATLIEGWLR
jgi:hypothetical protein